ncbi:DNA helicase-2/ATP-dependent DNA helicase PcrA [Pseudomonas frederiksbergensis]|uniref:UvrD-helicase domain-containing protein n=1 Tax=Pseudomonas frederiksbergensis TaxID=104087 RepID=UPI003D1BE75E
MTSLDAVVSNDDVDDAVDVEISRCLNLDDPQSFFLFAGAGSGKTRSLVTALQRVQIDFGSRLRLKGQRVGVITYTNAASEEIERRLAFDPTIEVSTIHSFAWSLIEGLNRDIREWLRLDLAADIEKLNKDEAKGRAGTKASATRLSKIASKTKRLANLDSVKRFVYSPTGENRGRDSLNHSEVIQLTSHFLTSKPAMQSILVGRFPLLLIDESQDTNKNLIDALFAVQSTHKARFALGLLGDMMQRIYSDGKEGLGQNLPGDWATPTKQMNHRCPRRVVSLINKVREATDKQQQKWRSDSAEGCIRLYILPSETSDKQAAEKAIGEHMAKISADDNWNDLKTCKTLTLEHRMAARRMGFLEMFVPLYEVESWRPNFLDGSLPIVRFFSEEVLPLIQAKKREDRFGIARIAREHSPLLSVDALRAGGNSQSQLQLVASSIDQLMSLWVDGADPSLAEVLRSVAATKLFSIPELLQPNAYRDKALDAVEPAVDGVDADRQSERAAAIDAFLEAPFSQIEPFANYVSGKAHFDTHQGVKGLQFNRVMVIMDDEEARGFMFKYENLFGGKGVGDPSVESTRRLFYVTCSRAMQSLALVAYTSSPGRVSKFAINEGWFSADEIVTDIGL